MKFIMFTKHLEGLEVSGIIKALQSVGVEGADLCVRPGYPVNPDNAEKQLPAAAKQFAAEGLSIPLVTTPGDFLDPKRADIPRVYAGCGEAGVANLKFGYWDWSKENDGYRVEVERIRLRQSPPNLRDAFLARLRIQPNIRVIGDAAKATRNHL